MTPAYRSVPKERCEVNIVKDAMKLLNSYLDEFPESDYEDNALSTMQIQPSSGLFSSYIGKPIEICIVLNELVVYGKSAFSILELNTNPYEFWISNRESYPRLSGIAIWIL